MRSEAARRTLGGPPPVRLRLGSEPVAPLKLATGCDRRCTFCAIPFFRGAFVSRPPDEILAEAVWLAGNGVRELFLVSENSTSYGKDFGNLRALERLLPELAAIPGIVRVRLSYLQPAELRPGLVEAICTMPGVAAYFDLSFQHASGVVLRRMRRFGDGRRFIELLRSIRELAPHAGARSNVIVGFPGETRADVAELERFLESAELDAIGVFGYSDEDGTEAATYDRKVAPATITGRVSRLTDLAEQLMAARAHDRVGSDVTVLVEEVGLSGAEHGGEPVAEGRAEHQGPEVDGSCRLVGAGVERLAVGDLVSARVVGSEGVDLIATLRSDASPADSAASAGSPASARSQGGCRVTARPPAAAAAEPAGMQGDPGRPGRAASGPGRALRPGRGVRARPRPPHKRRPQGRPNLPTAGAIGTGSSAGSAGTARARPGRVVPAGTPITATDVRPGLPRDPVADPVSPVSVYNIANALTILRLLLVPVFVVLSDDGRRRVRCLEYRRLGGLRTGRDH